MNELIIPKGIAAMTPEAINNVAGLADSVRHLPQERIKTTHTLHAGVYARTVLVPKGVMITGVLVKCDTILVVSGDVLVYVGEDAPVHLRGYMPLACAGGRKQVFIALEDTNLTMIFQSDAETIEEAENQFTDEADMLLSRKQKGCV